MIIIFGELRTSLDNFVKIVSKVYSKINRHTFYCPARRCVIFIFFAGIALQVSTVINVFYAGSVFHSFTCFSETLFLSFVSNKLY